MSTTPSPVTEDPTLNASMPFSFGKQSRASNVAKQIEASKRPVIDERASATATQMASSASDEEDDDEYGSNSDDEQQFPVTHELVITCHDKAVTSVTLDASGSRMITGSKDCNLKLFDFSSMSPTTIRAFKTVDPSATKSSANNDVHPIQQVAFSPLASNQVMIITALPQARIADRDGDVSSTCVKGDMYLRDLHNTKGHTSEVTAGAWHPSVKGVFVTASTDSSLRIWNALDLSKHTEIMVYKSKAVGSAGKARLTTVAWGQLHGKSGTLIAAAAFDGTLVLYGGEGPYHRPLAEIQAAHKPGTWTSALDFSPDGRLLVSRGGDDSIKLWDPSKFKTPLRQTELPSMSDQFPSSSIKFSPDGLHILVGSPSGRLHILNAGLSTELVTPVTPGFALVTAIWHERLNQIVTGSANAEVHILFDPEKSTGGARAVLTRAPKARHIDDDPALTMDLSHGVPHDDILAGGSFSGPRRKAGTGMTNSGKSLDPRRPHIPATTPFAKSQPAEEHIRASIPLSSMREEDPREALLKYAQLAKNDPVFTNAWANTQPKALYSEYSDEEDGPDKKKSRR